MKNIADSEIAWACPWWKLKYATIELYNQCVPILGLRFSIFISPSILYHQYGRRQFIVTILHNFEGFPLRHDFLEKVKTLWPRRTLEWNLNPNADVTIDYNYKTWVTIQVIEPPRLARSKRAPILQDESQKKKQRLIKKNGLIVLVLGFSCYVFHFLLLYALQKR